MMTLYVYAYQVLPFGMHRTETNRYDRNTIERFVAIKIN